MDIPSNLALFFLFLCGCIWGFTGVALNKHVEFDDPNEHNKGESENKSTKTADEENKETVSTTEGEETEREKKKPEPLIIQLLKNFKFILYYGLQQIGSGAFSVFIRFTSLGLGFMLANGSFMLTSYTIEATTGTLKVTRCK